MRYINRLFLHFYLQEVQLSQRGRAMLCVIEYFAKSLNVIRIIMPMSRASVHVSPY